MTWKPPLLPDHYAAGESQKSMIYSYLLFLWYVRLDRTGVVISIGKIEVVSAKYGKSCIFVCRMKINVHIYSRRKFR